MTHASHSKISQFDAPVLDVICIGRSSVDLYGQQTGGKLEDMASFAKYLGGSPTNISVGAARLGLKSAVITRVGNEHMGRFILQQLSAEKVDISGVVTDPNRLTALVLLGIRDREQFPLIFLREDCADMALSRDEISPAFIASAKAITVTGTHFSTKQVADASFYAIECAKAAGRKVSFDIDYRPNLWALGGHADGESRFAQSAEVTGHLQTIIPHCDLIVGTEEEWHIVGGMTDTLGALKVARALSDAVLVCKRGAMGCVVFNASIEGWESGISAPVQQIEVFNVLGAGDGFMAGFLRGWLREETWEVCARYANACGALAVSRHGCAPAYPSWEELDYLLSTGSSEFALRKDKKLSQIHKATTRLRRWDRLVAFAFDHRQQFDVLAEETGRTRLDIENFKLLALAAVKEVACDEAGAGLLVDDEQGRRALHKAADIGCWIGRPVEVSGAFPLQLNTGTDIGTALREWPISQCIKVLVPYRLDDDEKLRCYHDDLLVRLATACSSTGHELLVEIISARGEQAATPYDIPTIMEHFYGLGVYPDWWKLEPVDVPEFWQNCGDVVRTYDQYLQGIIVLGYQMTGDRLMNVFSAAKTEPIVKGFAVGRTLFADIARSWFEGAVSDEQATEKMTTDYRALIAAWDSA